MVRFRLWISNFESNRLWTLSFQTLNPQAVHKGSEQIWTVILSKTSRFKERSNETEKITLCSLVGEVIEGCYWTPMIQRTSYPKIFYLRKKDNQIRQKHFLDSRLSKRTFLRGPSHKDSLDSLPKLAIPCENRSSISPKDRFWCLTANKS